MLNTQRSIKTANKQVHGDNGNKYNCIMRETPSAKRQYISASVQLNSLSAVLTRSLEARREIMHMTDLKPLRLI